MGVGGEFAAGAALVAETFPERSRAMALGLLQALSTVGNMVAAIITMIIGNQSTTQFTLGQNWSGWRIAYLIGALPALVVLWIRASIREPAAWTDQKARGQSGEGKGLGNILELFTSRELLRRTLAGSLIATAGVGALWGVGNFSVDLVRVILAPADPRFTSYMFLLQQIGAFIGIYLFALAAERFGRRSTFIAAFVLAFIAIEIFFWTVQSVGSADPARGQILALCLAPAPGLRHPRSLWRLQHLLPRTLPHPPPGHGRRLLLQLRPLPRRRCPIFVRQPLGHLWLCYRRHPRRHHPDHRNRRRIHRPRNQGAAAAGKPVTIAL